MKAFPQFTRDYLMEEISYENLMYLLSVIPPYRGLEDNKGNKSTTGIPGTRDKNQKKHSHKQITHFNQFGL